MNYNWIKTQNELSSVIQSISIFETILSEHTCQLIMPNPTNGLIIQLGAPSYFSFDGINYSKFPKIYFALASISKQSLLLKCNGYYKSILVVFKPGILYSSLKFPLSECINNPILDAQLILPKNIYSKLLQQSEQPNDIHEITTNIKDTINYYCEKLYTQSITLKATELLITNKGKICLQQLAELVNTTPRTLERRFKYEQGTSPNSYARLVKHHAIIRDIVSSQRIDWLDIIVNYNFHDKAHFIKDFKKITGYSPSSYLKHDHSLDLETRINFELPR